MENCLEFLRLKEVTLQNMDERVLETCFNREAVIEDRLTKTRTFYISKREGIYGLPIMLP